MRTGDVLDARSEELDGVHVGCLVEENFRGLFEIDSTRTSCEAALASF